MDKSRSRYVHLTVFIFLIPALLGYAGLLLVIWYYLGGLIEIGVFVVVQIIIGLPLSRLSFTMGIQAREVLGFQETSTLTGAWHREKTSIAVGKIPQLFEQIQLSLPKSDKMSFDDLNDLGWFCIVLWSMLSIVVSGFMVPGIILNVSPAIILTIVCVVLYRNGYQSVTSLSFDEVIDHLEYLVISRMNSFRGLLDVAKVEYYVTWMKTNGKMVLEDFAAESLIESKLSKSLITIEYNIGLPTLSFESFVISSKNMKVRELVETKSSTLIHEEGWQLIVKNDNLLEKVNLVNLQYSPNWSSLSSMISSPSKIENDSETIRVILNSLYQDL